MTHDINVIAYTAKTNLEEAPLDAPVRERAAEAGQPGGTIIGLVQRFALPGEPEAA